MIARLRRVVNSCLLMTSGSRPNSCSGSLDKPRPGQSKPPICPAASDAELLEEPFYCLRELEHI